MDGEKLEQKLQDYFQMEVQKVEPSREWWDRAISQLGERKPSFWERCGSWFSHPAWRTVTATVLVVVLAVGVLWGTGILPRLPSGQPPVPAPSPTVPAPTVVPAPTPAPTPAPVPRPAPPPPFKALAVPEEAHYLPGEPVEVKLSLTNISSAPMTLDRYPPEIRVTPRLNIDQVLFSIAGGTQPRELKPNETVSVDFTWDQKDRAGRQVQPGWYNVIFGEITVRQGGSRYTFNPGAYVLIQYPQGVMEKSFDLNQSQTVNGITVTLERVELTATGMKVYAFNTPPGYNLPPGQPGPAPSMWIHAEAEYSIDGGAARKTGSSGIRFLDNGTRHTWNNLDPVPSDAKELTFRITKLGDWQSLWQFKIPLQ